MPAAKKKKKIVLEMSPELPSSEGKPGRKPGSGLKTNNELTRKSPDAAAGRLSRRVGRPSNEDLTPGELPFESSLAFILEPIGGRNVAIEYARLGSANDVRFQRFIHAYDALSISDRKVIRLESLCAAAEMSPPEFFGAIATIAVRHNMDASRFLVAVNHTKVVAAAVEAAQSPFGIEDRKVIFQHSGFLPTSKGTQINVQANANSNSQAAAVNPGSVSTMPTFETSSKRASELVRGDASTRRLSAPVKELEAPSEIIDAEVVDDA